MSSKKSQFGVDLENNPEMTRAPCYFNDLIQVTMNVIFENQPTAGRQFKLQRRIKRCDCNMR